MIYAILSLIFSSAEILLLEQVFKLNNPVIFMSLFYFFAFSIMLVNFIIFGHKKINKKEEIIKNKKNLYIYISSGAIGNALWFSSLYFIGASGIALLSILQRFFIIYYSAKKLDEKMTTKQYILSSVVVLSSLFFSKDNNFDDFLGIFLCILSYFFFTISDIFQKKISNDINWDIALLLRQFLQFLFFFLIAIIYIIYNKFDIYSINYNIFYIAFCVSFIGAVLGKITHYKAIKKMKLNRVTLIEQFKSVVVFFVSAFVLNVSLTNIQIFFALLMLISLVLVNFEDYKKNN